MPKSLAEQFQDQTDPYRIAKIKYLERATDGPKILARVCLVCKEGFHVTETYCMLDYCPICYAILETYRDQNYDQARIAELEKALHGDGS